MSVSKNARRSGSPSCDQESQPETYAISKADLLLKGEGEEAENFANGSTLSQDAFPSREFDFMLSNPPYGKSWKTDLERMGGKKDIQDTRFVVEHDGDPEFSLITRSNDGQLMFLVNKLSKMKQDSPLGSRIAEVHNGSSLFTGDAGQGESNIRRWVIENDWLEAIIALPLNIFYNTGYSLLCKQDLRSERCLGVGVSVNPADRESFLVHWVLLNGPWSPDRELDTYLLENPDCFHTVRKASLGLYQLQ